MCRKEREKKKRKEKRKEKEKKKKNKPTFFKRYKIYIKWQKLCVCLILNSLIVYWI